MATSAEAIPASGGLNEILQLLQLVKGVQGTQGGEQVTTSEDTQTGGPESVSSSYGSSSSTPGDLKPLQDVLAQQMPLGTMEGMAPILQAIFQQGSKQLPDIFSKAGATGSRVTHNSTVGALQNELAADLANKVALLLSQNQQASAKTAEAIAAQGRRTAQSQSSSSVSKSTPIKKTTTQTNKLPNTQGALGKNGVGTLASLLAGGTGLNMLGGLKGAAGLLGGLFSGGGGAADAGNPPYVINPPSFTSAGNAPLASNPSVDLGGLMTQLPDAPQVPGNYDAFNAILADTPPVDFSGGGVGVGGFDFGNTVDPNSWNPSTNPVGAASNTDWSNMFPTLDSVSPGFEAWDPQAIRGMLPEDADWFGGAFADGGSISKVRGGARYNLGTNPVLERVAAASYNPSSVPTAGVIPVGQAASFGGSKQPTLTTSPARSATGQSASFDAQGRLVYTPTTTGTTETTGVPVAPTPVDRATALETYRKTLANQDLYSASGDTLSIWKDPTPYNVIDPETGLQREDPFAGFAQEAKNGMFGTPDVFDARRKQIAQKELADIKATIPISMSLEQAKKTFTGIESLRPELQQAIADDPRRFAASMKGLLPITDPKLKGWQAYSREGDGYSYSTGGRLEPTKAGNDAMQWHPEYGLVGPPGAIAPYYEQTGGLLTPLVGPALTIGSYFFPVLAPFAAVYNGMQAAKNDNTTGFFASMVGLGGAAAGLAGNKTLGTAAGVGSSIIKIGDAYFKYQEYQDYLDKLEEAQRKGTTGSTTAPKEPTPVDPATVQGTTGTQGTTGNQLQSQMRTYAQGKAQTAPANERVLGENSILSDKVLQGPGTPAYDSGTSVTLESLPGLMSLASSINGVTTDQVPGKADGGQIPFRMQMIDKLIDGSKPVTPSQGSASGGSMSRDEEMAKFRGVTPAAIETERARKLQDALRNRKVPSKTSGLLQGPGTGTSDSMLIAASTDEYVLPADVVSQLGGPLQLDKLLSILHFPT